ncbi:hypothetical protein MIR68_000986 [Amoeboaphelidium protococcarum]|nr:hypothetical protein MIR68_000986 [Amoeboaphelidium protococcarum]
MMNTSLPLYQSGVRGNNAYNNSKHKSPLRSPLIKLIFSRWNILVVVLLAFIALYASLPLIFYTSLKAGQSSDVNNNGLKSYDRLDQKLDRDFTSHNDGSTLSPDEADIVKKLKGVADKVKQQTQTVGELNQDLLVKDVLISDLKNQLGSEKSLRAKLEESLKTIQANSVLNGKKTSAEKNSDTSNGVNGIYKKVYPKLPESSIWCVGEKKYDRVCRFKNLYYHPKMDLYFVVITEHSILDNVPKDRSPALVDMTSIDDHSYFYFNYDEATQDKFKDVLVNVVEKKSFLISRFHVGNIMHSLHDDALGLYYNIRRFANTEDDFTATDKPQFAQFSTDHLVYLTDGHEAYEYGHVFNLFTDHPAQYKSSLSQDKDVITVFNDAIVGQSKALNWYQYGFLSPQGPIKDKQVNGYYVRDFADYIAYKLDLFKPEFDVPEPVADVAVVFSRRQNRLILNEDDLLNGIATKFQLKPQFIRMEDLTFRQQIEILRRTKVAVGMHGSVLIMSVFMPRRSVLIELYPYAVPPEGYTPYKTLAGLKGMNLVYRPWKNTHKENNVPHPDRDMYHGGLVHLSDAERRKIEETLTVPPHVCCTDPYWLFRIYQDTKVEVQEVIALIQEGLEEGKKMNLNQFRVDSSVLPSMINENSITCSLVYTGSYVKGVLVEWAEPWNGIKPDKYSIWEHLAYKEFFTDTNKIMLEHPYYKEGSELGIYVRSIKNDIVGKYSGRHDCKITLPKQ